MARIYRDAYGVPHVRAADVLDLARGQGEVTARDRTWQLEWQRRRATGTTAEVLGPAGLAWDRLVRRTEVAATARRAHARLEPETQAFVAAYVDGVNAGLAAVDKADVPELCTLGVAPTAWEPWTPLAVFLGQHLLFAGLGLKLFTHRVTELLGPEAAGLLSHEGPDLAGSNAWAVGGARTASGLPLIGGDPHRVIENPGVYLQVRLACDDPADQLDVVGFAFPGVPGVQHFAHAGEVGDDRVLSLRTASGVLDDLGFDALLPLLRARSVSDVDGALDRWVEPVNNAVVADRSGRVLYRVAGRVPVRDDGNRRGIVDAADPTTVWAGWVIDLPRHEVPVDGSVVTANERRGPESDPIGTSFAPPHRAARLRELIGARNDLDAAAFAGFHGDVRLPTLANVRALLEPLAPSPAGEEVRDRILAWDGEMAAGSRGAAAFATWRGALAARLAAEPVLAPLAEPWLDDAVLATYVDPAPRVAAALESLVAAGMPLGIDVAALATAALDDAVGHPETWGEAHVLRPLHAFDLAGLAPVAPELPVVALGGDNDCVRCTGSLPGIDDTCWRGSVARYVWDLADRQAGGWVVPLGAAADGPHRTDQLALWTEVRLAPIVTDWERLTETT